MASTTQRWLIGFVAALLLTSVTAHAATLDVPTPHTTLSGVGVIHGWKCKAGELTVRFDGGPPLPLLHGAERQDVLDAGACDHANVGFVSIINWGELGDGQHTAVVYDDGVEFDRSTFDVVTTGEPFLERATGQCIVPDFPAPNEAARFIWNQPTQHMELAEVGGMELLPVVEECEETTCPVCEVCQTCPDVRPSTPFDGTWDIRFTLTRDVAGYCAPNGRTATSIFRVSNHSVSAAGSDWATGHPATFSGIVSAAGRVEGTMLINGDGLGSARGRLSGRSGSGTWFNVFGCSARWTASKR